MGNLINFKKWNIFHVVSFCIKQYSSNVEMLYNWSFLCLWLSANENQKLTFSNNWNVLQDPLKGL